MKKLTAVGKYILETLILLALTIVAKFVEPIASIKLFIVVFINHKSAWQILKAYDILGNFYLNDYSGMTISERSAEAREDKKKWGCKVCKFLDFFDKKHCDKSLNFPKLEGQ